MSGKDDDYIGDVQYEAWRRGLPDINYDRIEQAKWDGLSADECVSREQQHYEQRRREERERQEREEFEAQQAYYDELERRHHEQEMQKLGEE